MAATDYNAFVLIKPAEVSIDPSTNAVRVRRARVFGVATSLDEARKTRKQLNIKGVMILPFVLNQVS